MIGEYAEVDQDRRLLSSEHLVNLAYQLCVNCEDETGERAIRKVTPHGTCGTCGSSSMVAIRNPVWKWQGEAK